MFRNIPLAFSLFVVAAMLFLSSATVIAAGTRPDAPDNLQGAITGNQVTLTWDIPDDDDEIRGYNVYVDGGYRTTVQNNSYTGPVIEDKLTTFYVVAFDSKPTQYSRSSQELVLPESLIPSDLTIPPSVPTDLTGEIADGQVTIQWSASTDDEAVGGYNVYRDNAYETTVLGTSYTTDNAADETHSWYVVAFDIRKNFSQRSERIQLPDPGPVDTTIAPSPPGELQGEVNSGTASDTVTLSWQPAEDDQAVAGYNIYLNGDYKATRFGTAYTQQVPTGSSNTFKIVAFDFDGNFSTSSDTLTLPEGTAPVDPGVAPSIPANLAIDTVNSPGQTSVTLTWDPSTSTVPVKGYNVYRDNSYISTVNVTTFTESLAIGTPATYAVVAFDNFDNYSTRSERLSILGAINQAPFFASLDDQQLLIEQPWELLLRPVDVDGDPAGVLVDGLPEGALLLDNLDGSRSLTWEPGIDDIGEYDIEVVAFDLLDPSVRSSEQFKVIVANELMGGPTPFSLQIAEAAFNVVEGDKKGISIPIVVERIADFDAPITLSVQTQTPADANQLGMQFTLDTLELDDTTTDLNVQLAIGTLPLLPEQRRLVVTATSGQFSDQASVTLAVTPVPLDDVYLLIGQSNMVGSSEFTAKRAGPGEPDEPNSRILQLNPSANKSSLLIDESIADNVFDLNTPLFEPAEDPLHTPIDPKSGRKAGTKIGMGLSFAKAALPNTTRNIVLVPAAWSASSFCDSQLPGVHWNPTVTDNVELGNTLLFDRAIERVNQTLLLSGGILRGILWHQGENDGNSRCAEFYEDNLVEFVEALRTSILPDARGQIARGPLADIPFIAGTMSRGRDENSDFSEFSASKSVVDGIHRNISSIVPFSAVTNNDDLVPENGYPCGSGSCIHFGSAALREMGARTYESLLRAVGE